MKFKIILPALMLGMALAANADGYKDGIEYYKAGQFENAKDILERNINDAKTDKALAYYYLGQTSLALNDNAAAKANFEKGISADAENPYNYVGLGALALLDGQEKVAEEDFKTAQKFGKKNNEITVDIARAYFNADPVKYGQQVTKYLAKAHKDSKNREASIYILEGDMHFANRDLGQAATSYEQAITFDVDNPEGYVKYANAYIGVNPQFSIQKLEELLAKQPTSALAQRELAEKYYENNQWTKASQTYGEYIKNPNHFPQDKSRYSVLLYASNDYQKSLDVANDLLKSNPNDFQALRIRMLDLYELGKYEEAAQAAEAFLNLKENKTKAKYAPLDYITYANTLEQLNKPEDALIQYQKAVDLDPTRADNLKMLSDAYSKAGNFQLAADVIEKYLQALERPSLTDLLQASGRFLNAANRATDEAVSIADAEKGLDAINQVIERAAEPDASFYQRQGRLNYAKGGKKINKDVHDSYMKVVEILDADPANADAANPNNQRALYNEAYLFIGNYYQEIGDKAKQEEMYKLSDSYKK